MSIASEISRLQGAKADIKTAIQGKGVTVPSAAKLDDYADYIDDIPQGTTPTGTKQISVTSNGTQTENVSGYANAQLNVNVPNSYSAGDEGKVVNNGALVAQTSDTVTQNDTYDTTLINSLTVNVSGGSGLSWEDIASGAQPSGLVDLGDATSIIDYFMYYRQFAQEWMVVGGSVTSLGMSAFRNCTYLTEAHFPILSTMSSAGYVFNACTRLSLVDLGEVAVIRPNAFNSCSALKTLILRRSSVTELQQTASLNGTPFASDGSGGTLYVPQSLIASYQAATNWGTILGYANNSIKPIEGSIYELS